MMCEIPSNAVLADRFLEHFDGFSIGSNDMTQLTLAVDRDAGGLIAATFDERDDAVKAMLAMAIAACRKAGNMPASAARVRRTIPISRSGWSNRRSRACRSIPIPSSKPGWRWRANMTGHREYVDIFRTGLPRCDLRSMRVTLPLPNRPRRFAPRSAGQRSRRSPPPRRSSSAAATGRLRCVCVIAVAGHARAGCFADGRRARAPGIARVRSALPSCRAYRSRTQPGAYVAQRHGHGSPAVHTAVTWVATLTTIIWQDRA